MDSRADNEPVTGPAGPIEPGTEGTESTESTGGADGDEQPSGALSAREVEMLAFERQWWKFAGAKEQAIRELFDLTATRYYQVLNTLIDRPEALAQDPMLVKRLRRTRDARRRSGSSRTLGAHG
jgi:hypothetical protein